MSASWAGSIVSVDCGNVLGVFEGTISSVDEENQTISLINVSRNSVKCQVPEVTLSTHDIKDLKLLESTVHKNGNVNNNEYSQAVAPIDPPVTNGFIQNSTYLEDNQKKKGEGKKKKRCDGKKWLAERDEACFSTPVDSEVLDIDFDFEKNLALFDKRAVMEEINALSKSDYVKLVDCNKRGQTKYRHDQNVLDSDIPILKQITVPCKIDKEYVTDSGLVIPCATVEFKKLIYRKASEVGINLQVIIDSISRSACDMVLHLIGGCHRLNPENTHQRPSVIVLCGSHNQGIQGINCGRHLANHCVKVTVVCPQASAKAHTALSSELNLFKLSGGSITESTTGLASSIDIIIDALDSQEADASDNVSWKKSVRQWSVHCKAPVLCLDPPPNCNTADCNYILSPVLPYAFHEGKCSVHICDIGLPKGVLTSLGCTYSSPFGSKFVIPLYSTFDSCS